MVRYFSWLSPYGGNTDAKAWKDIWGSGQGIGSIKDSPSVQALVSQLTLEFKEAVEDLNQSNLFQYKERISVIKSSKEFPLDF